MTRRTGTALIALGLLACEGPTELHVDQGFLALRVAFAPGAASEFATGRVILQGPTPLEVNMVSGTDTIRGLRPGSYTVGLELLDTGGAVQSFGSSPATVRSGALTEVSVTLTAFPAGSLQSSYQASAGQPITVSTSPIAGAASYEWQWDSDANFTSPDSQEGQASIQLTLDASHYVRVRGLNSFGGPSVWSNVSFVAVDSESSILLSAASVSFSSPQGGERGNGLVPIQTRSVVITNDGAATIDWTGSANAEWLEVDPPSGSLFAGRSDTVDIVKNRASGVLRDGTYQEVVSFGDGAGVTTLTVEHTVTAGPPAVPDQFNFDEVTPTRVTISWRDNSDDEEWFQIEEGDNFAPWQKIGTVPPGTQTFSDTDVRSGMLLRYRVRACSSTWGPCENPLNNDGGPNAAHDQSSVIAARNAEGNVVSTGGNPIANVQVTLRRCQTWGTVNTPPTAGACSSYAAGDPLTLPTASNGGFTFERLPAGVFEVQVDAGSAGFNGSTPAAALYDLRTSPKESRSYVLN